MDEEDLRSLLPLGFGKQEASDRQLQRDRAASTRLASARRQNDGKDSRNYNYDNRLQKQGSESDSSDSDGIGPPIPASASDAVENRENDNIASRSNQFSDILSDDSDCSESLDDDDDELPLSHELVLRDHSRSVTALTMDSDGTRIYSGGQDYTVRVWEFSSMRAGAPRPLSVVDPTDSKEDNVGRYPVRNLDYCSSSSVNNSDDTSAAPLLFIRAATRPQLLTRDGVFAAEYASGDPYIHDLRKTKGHTAELTHGVWRPRQTLFATTSADGTVRLWDSTCTRQQLEVLVLQRRAATSGGTRLRIDTCSWSPLSSSGVLALAASDGSLSIWQPGQGAGRTQQHVEEAFGSGMAASSLAFAPDGNRLALRATDGTLALWDVRKFNSPLVHRSLSCGDDRADVIFTPDGCKLLTGVVSSGAGFEIEKLDSEDTVSGRPQSGALAVIDAETLGMKQELRLTPTDENARPIRIFWSTKINQIAVSSSNGQINVMFSEHNSLRGAKDVVMKLGQRRHIDDIDEYTSNIETVAIDHVGRGPLWRKKQAPDYSQTPQYIEQPKLSDRQLRAEAAERQHSGRDLIAEDPREALLKYAEKAQNDPIFTKLYTKTQPHKIFASQAEDEASGDENNHDKSESKRARIS